MKLNWGHSIIIVYVIFVGGILLLAYNSSQQKFDLVQNDYYGAELKYQEVIDATQRASNLTEALQVESKGSLLHITLPKNLQTNASKVSIEMYCIADEKGDMKKEKLVQNGVFDIELLSTMKGNYTLKLSVEQNGLAYYFEKKLIL
ncbi:MAG: hypothetical protein EB092_06830 [Chitinophagia bacterium]|jgi:hypothetical protein|nr:hypothetical protein [Chitinophagia bacterium]NCA30744.1 hypothetical protein [Chitinophagia bacterium]NDD16704.1 hypothetical protein [Chitinophagia bacterium]